MRADVFQAVALCCHARAYLSGETDKLPEMLGSSTFANVHEISFERSATGKLSAGVVADASGPWLRRIAKEGVERLNLSLAGCPLDPLTQAGEPWGIISDGDVGVEIWQPTWKKRLRSHSDPAPWKVAYVATRTNRWLLKAPPPAGSTEAFLDAVIQEAGTLNQAMGELLHGVPLKYRDLYPDDWPASARGLGEKACRVAVVLRSENWARLSLDRTVPYEELELASRKLWTAALIGLEASVRPEAEASERPTGHTSRLSQ